MKILRGKSTRADDPAHRSARPGDSIVAHRRRTECIINDLRAGEFCIANATRGTFARTYTCICMYARTRIRAGNGEKDDEGGKKEGDGDGPFR